MPASTREEMIKLRHFIPFLMAWLLTLPGMAQPSDLQTRWGLELEKDFRKGFDLSLSYQARVGNNAQAFQGSYFSLSTGYKINKWLRAQAEIRYATSPVWDKFRTGAGLVARKNFHKNQLEIRLLYQYEWYYQSIPELGQNLSKNILRLRLQYTRKLVKNLKAFVGIEPRWMVKEQLGYVQRVRNSLGLEWGFFKHHSLQVVYFYQPEFNSSYTWNNTLHVINLNYLVSIPKLKKKQKAEPEKDKGKEGKKSKEKGN